MNRETLKSELGFEDYDVPTDTELLETLMERLTYKVVFNLESGGRGHYTYGTETEDAASLVVGSPEYNRIAAGAGKLLRDWNSMAVGVSLNLECYKSASHEDNIHNSAKTYYKELRDLEVKTRELADWRRSVKALEDRQDELKESVYQSRLADLMAKKP